MSAEVKVVPLEQKFTVEELVGLFGEEIPIEVMNFIFGPAAEKLTIGEVRAEVRKIAASRFSPAPTDEDPNTPEAQAAARLSLRDTFIAEKGLWGEFAETVLHQQSSLEASGAGRAVLTQTQDTHEE